MNLYSTLTITLLKTAILAPAAVSPFSPKYLPTRGKLMNYAGIATKLFDSPSGSDTTMPTIEQLSSDPFMKQLGHATEVVSLLRSICEGGDEAASATEKGVADEELLIDLLKAQLSHSDGIRGFFVSYLTGDGVTPADADEVPPPLLSAMNSVETDELISLACMNVIMPTAMVTMHEDPELANNSLKTSKRGIKVLKGILDKPGAKEQCEAIRNVAIGNIELKDGSTKYWIEFFEKWGYKEKQKEDIQIVMTEILSL
eukprot:CAMPEP_0203665068 /NCGR_PEP_ID=MMETSP0090-20130426/2337_1 /ASSEMBLY_ACC=CAM_ASM_001088 /TAXON_ID=426623 /ORGANISM="Chaetoceros affinis, Strain CCMP159" /LENGTH=256 /DNA_ID=CAMNT_0050528503 /DNA_START=48 /DNA_END=818 /DNA_ORIENTATION=-